MKSYDRPNTVEEADASPRWYNDLIVKSADPYSDGDGYSISTEEGSGFGMTIPEGVEPPQPGDAIRLYAYRGSLIFGYRLRGELIRFDSIEDERQRDEKHTARRHAENVAKFDAERDDRDRRIRALPAPLHWRIDQLQLAGGDEWRYDGESYELFVCEQAVEFAKLGSDEAISNFVSLSGEDQHAAVPGMSADHSGNTFGAAVLLARLLVTEQPFKAIVWPQALSPLVGDPRYPQDIKRDNLTPADDESGDTEQP